MITKNTSQTLEGIKNLKRSPGETTLVKSAELANNTISHPTNSIITAAGAVAPAIATSNPALISTTTGLGTNALVKKIPGAEKAINAIDNVVGSEKIANKVANVEKARKFGKKIDGFISRLFKKKPNE